MLLIIVSLRVKALVQSYMQPNNCQKNVLMHESKRATVTVRCVENRAKKYITEVNFGKQHTSIPALLLFFFSFRETVFVPEVTGSRCSQSSCLAQYLKRMQRCSRRIQALSVSLTSRLFFACPFKMHKDMTTGICKDPCSRSISVYCTKRCTSLRHVYVCPCVTQSGGQLRIIPF